MKPVYRLVDTSERVKIMSDFGAGPAPLEAAARGNDIGTLDYPSAVVDDETRYVLAAPPKKLVFKKEAVKVSDSGAVTIALELPPDIARGERLLLEPYIKIGKIWRQLAPRRLNLGANSASAGLPYRLSGLGEVAGQKLDIHIYAYVVDWSASVSHETRVLDMPQKAQLEFGYAILEPAHEHGAVRFTISACRRDKCETVFEKQLNPSNDGERAWMNATVSLDQFANQSIRLRFVTQQLNASSKSLSMAVWSNPTIYEAAAATKTPNVILLSIDTLRADHLSTYDYAHSTSPFMDERFGRRGTVFQSCMSAATTTSASHMSIFTGLQPSEHGLLSGLERLPEWLHPLGELLRAEGFETGAVTENGWLGASHGFGRGFNVYAENKSPDIMSPTGQVDRTFERAGRWITRHRDKPFFLFLHTFQVHEPYAPPVRYQKQFTSVGAESIGPDSQRHLRELVAYDQEIRFTDEQLASLFRTLEENGVLDNTVFIVTSDHGEAFLEHDMLRHATILYEEVVHVPLMISGPGIPSGGRVTQLVGHIDIAPTVLELLGVRPVYQMSGRSLLPALTTPNDDSDRIYVSETWSRHAIDATFVVRSVEFPSFAARRGHTKLIKRKTAAGYRFEQYDLETDPLEKTDLLGSDTAPDPALAAALESYLSRAEATRMQLRGAAGASGGPQNPTRELDPAQEEKLRALGYLH
jgi:arylsulfatase A-like enzyme